MPNGNINQLKLKFTIIIEYIKNTKRLICSIQLISSGDSFNIKPGSSVHNVQTAVTWRFNTLEAGNSNYQYCTVPSTRPAA